jgi:hypothetical protein
MRRPWLAALLLMALVALGLTAPGHAHVPARADNPSDNPSAVAQTADVDAGAPTATAAVLLETIAAAGPESPTVPWVPLLALVVAASLIRPLRSRRTAVALLVALLAVFTFEGGVHSVHHLGDEDAAAQCAVASASSNLTGASASPVELIAPVETEAAERPPELGRLPQRSTRLAQGRAPPFLA